MSNPIYVCVCEKQQQVSKAAAPVPLIVDLKDNSRIAVLFL